MVKITAEKSVKKLNLGSNLTSNYTYSQVLHGMCMCVALSFLFGYLLSTRCVCPQIGRAFEASIDSKPYCVATCCSLPLLLHIFLKRIIA